MADDAHSNSLERAIELLYKLRALIQERGFDIDEDVMTLFQLFGPVEEGLPGDAQMIMPIGKNTPKLKQKIDSQRMAFHLRKQRSTPSI